MYSSCLVKANYGTTGGVVVGYVEKRERASAIVENRENSPKVNRTTTRTQTIITQVESSAATPGHYATITASER